jgi:hypothetical protein
MLGRAAMRRTPALHRIVLGVGITTLAVGCAANSPAVGEGEEIADREEMALFVASKLVWPSPAIPVCWVDPRPEHAAARGWTRDAAARSWQSVSAVRFIGWGTCAQNDGDGIRIAISDENPYANVGTSGAWLPFNVLLNFSFQNWSAGFCSSENFEYCARVIAVHELGHALGFDHEQNRPDSPTWCRKDAHASGDTIVGPWDLDSVMNYCNPHWAGDGTLSDIDVAGVQQVYGKAPSGNGDGSETAPACTFACSDYGYSPGQCHQGWFCDGSCIEKTGCNQ